MVFFNLIERDIFGGRVMLTKAPTQSNTGTDFPVREGQDEEGGEMSIADSLKSDSDLETHRQPNV